MTRDALRELPPVDTLAAAIDAPRALALAAAAGDPALLRAAAAPPWNLAGTLVNLGEAACRRRDPARAAAAFREALDLGRRSGSAADVVRALNGLGRVAVLRRDWARAARRFGAAAGLAAAAPPSGIAADGGDGDQDGLIARTRAALGDDALPAAWAALGDDALPAAWAAGRAMTPGDVLGDAPAPDAG
jgi:hypothetical protein